MWILFLEKQNVCRKVKATGSMTHFMGQDSATGCGKKEQNRRVQVVFAFLPILPLGIFHGKTQTQLAMQN